MKNVYHQKKWNLVVVQVHAEPQLVPLIKIKHDDKSDKDFVKLKLHRDLTSDKLDLYEFKMALFKNGDPEEFLLFVHNLIMTLTASVTMGVDLKVQYICTLVCGE